MPSAPSPERELPAIWQPLCAALFKAVLPPARSPMGFKVAAAGTSLPTVAQKMAGRRLCGALLLCVSLSLASSAPPGDTEDHARAHPRASSVHVFQQTFLVSERSWPSGDGSLLLLASHVDVVAPGRAAAALGR